MPVPSESGVPKAKKKVHKHRSSHLDLNTQLVEASRLGKVRVVKRLLESGADPNHRGGGHNQATPLIVAAALQEEDVHKAVCTLLLSKGAGINMQDALGKTALMHAILCGHHAAVGQLLSHGAEMGVVDKDGNTALAYAAAQESSDDCVSELVMACNAQGVHVDNQNHQGLTPLLIAAQASNMPIVKLLVEGGASLSKRDLEHFMNAHDWMKQSDCFTDQDLEFLSPSRKKRNFYRQERLRKGIKTLMDFLPTPDGDGGTDSPNVFTVQRSDVNCKTHIGHHAFPSLQGAEEIKTTSSSSSMFDIEVSTKPISHTTPVNFIHDHNYQPQFSSVAHVKADLYKSPYLSKRQSMLLKNSRSEGYHSGALAPLHTSTNHTHTSKKDTQHLKPKTTKLPPILKK